MYEIESEWPAHFAYTTQTPCGDIPMHKAKNTLNACEGLLQLEILSLNANYAADRGRAVNVGLYQGNGELHLNEESYNTQADTTFLNTVLTRLWPSVAKRNPIFSGGVAADGLPDKSFAQVQGPGWSSEYTLGEPFKPRADQHCLLKIFFLTLFPQASPWETAASVSELHSLPCVKAGLAGMRGTAKPT